MKSYMPEEDKRELELLARRAGLSVSETVRRLSKGAALPSSDRHKDVREMMRINADLGRLGNLLKLGIVEESLERATAMALLADIRTRQGELKTAIKKM